MVEDNQFMNLFKNYNLFFNIHLLMVKRLKEKIHNISPLKDFF